MKPSLQIRNRNCEGNIYYLFNSNTPRFVSRRRVLIVEDDFSVETVMDTILRDIQPHVTVDWVTDAKDASEKISDGKYDLVISDILLDGEMTGVDLWDICKKNYPTVPLVLMSSFLNKKILQTMKSLSLTEPVLQ